MVGSATQVKVSGVSLTTVRKAFEDKGLSLPYSDTELSAVVLEARALLREPACFATRAAAKSSLVKALVAIARSLDRSGLIGASAEATEHVLSQAGQAVLANTKYQGEYREVWDEALAEALHSLGRPVTRAPSRLSAGGPSERAHTIRAGDRLHDVLYLVRIGAVTLPAGYSVASLFLLSGRSRLIHLLLSILLVALGYAVRRFTFWLQRQFVMQKVTSHGVIGFGISDSKPEAGAPALQDTRSGEQVSGDHSDDDDADRLAVQILRDENEALKRQLASAAPAAQGQSVAGLPAPPGLMATAPQALASPHLDAGGEPAEFRDQLAAFRAFSEGAAHPGPGVPISSTGRRMGLFASEPNAGIQATGQASSSQAAALASSAPPFQMPAGSAAAASAAPPHQSYAPLLPSASAVGDRPLRGTEALLQLARTAQSRMELGDGWWSVKLWSDVMSMCTRGEVAQPLMPLLAQHGFQSEPASCRPPELPAFIMALEAARPASLGAVGGSGGPGASTHPAAAAFAGSSGGAARHGAALAADMKRAGPEIYSSLLEANLSARDWLNQFYTGNRKTATWTDLWNAATTVDFRVEQCRQFGGQPAIDEMLATDDLVELYLRRLAAFVYGTRTSDWSGANYILAVKAPGSEVDVAPTWLVSDATAFSKAEYQREDRVKSLRKLGKGKDNSKGSPKGGGKGAPKGGAKDPQG